jgi:hypothetical protein
MKTAVEWLEEKLSKYCILTISVKADLKKAKEMEKEQIMDAYNQGSNDYGSQCYQPEQWYNETFKSE